MNNFILEYYQKIKDGSVVVGTWTRLGYEYIVKGLENKSFFYSAKKAKAAITFVENFVHHHEGALAPGLLKLELWQKAFLSAAFGIVDKDGNRQFREIVLVVARKNGKTLFAAAVAEYMAYLDGEHGARVYFCAPKLQQANLCFDAFVQSVGAEKELAAMAKKRRTDIYIESTNTSAMPLAYSAKKSDGLNIHLAVADEIAAWQGESGLKFYEVLKSSMGARRQPMLLSISTAGYETDGIYDELLKRATRVLKGDSNETRLLPILYIIDDPQKWNDINELQKSNPNLGVSVSVDYLLEEIRVAEGSLSKKAEFLTKYCNVKQNSSQAWLDALAVDNCFGEVHDLKEFEGSYCVGGIDLSQTTDLTSCCVVIEKDGKLHVFSKFFLPAERIDEATARDNIPYRAYIQRGILKRSGDNYVDYKDCYNWFRYLVETLKIYPLKIGYDRYTAQYLVQNLKGYGFHCDDVYQGHNLTPVIRETEGLINDGAFRFGDNDLLKIHLLDTALKLETEGNKCKIVKLNSKVHIDGTAALLDALTVRQKYYAEIGEKLKNKQLTK